MILFNETHGILRIELTYIYHRRRCIFFISMFHIEHFVLMVLYRVFYIEIIDSLFAEDGHLNMAYKHYQNK